jgi:O-methyltransferase
MVNKLTYIKKIATSHFPKLVNLYIKKRYRPITMGACDKSIQMDPLWNHVVAGDQKLIDLISKECNSGDLLMSFQECINLIWATKSTAGIKGEMAELGVYSGSSAKLILSCLETDSRNLYLFDTFSGIPEITPGIDEVVLGSMAGKSFEDVKIKLKHFGNRTKFYCGMFPATASNINSNIRFSFVNLDADTYNSTKSALKYFYELLMPGGMILIHDYSSISCPGVKLSVDEYFADKNDKPIPLWHTQCLIIKNGAHA